jgi:hypothetical protein
MDRNQLMQAVCNDLRPNAIDPQNPYVPVDSVMPTIAQLTAENERLQRVVEQSTKGMEVDEKGEIWLRALGFWVRVGNNDTHPDLYAQLKGADRG